MSADEERIRALELLEATHEFPVRYTLRVIVMNEATVIARVRIAAEAGVGAPLSGADWEEIPSRAGRYLSLRIAVFCVDAAAVLDLHSRMRGLEGVVQIL